MTGDKASMLAAQESAGLTKFIRVAKALCRRHFFAGLRQGFYALTGFGSRTRQGGFQSVGVKRPRQEVVDGDVISRQSRGA